MPDLPLHTVKFGLIYRFFAVPRVIFLLVAAASLRLTGSITKPLPFWLTGKSGWSPFLVPSPEVNLAAAAAVPWPFCLLFPSPLPLYNRVIRLQCPCLYLNHALLVRLDSCFLHAKPKPRRNLLLPYLPALLYAPPCLESRHKKTEPLTGNDSAS